MKITRNTVLGTLFAVGLQFAWTGCIGPGGGGVAYGDSNVWIGDGGWVDGDGPGWYGGGGGGRAYVHPGGGGHGGGGGHDSGGGGGRASGGGGGGGGGGHAGGGGERK